jgi:hypothetical protein
MDWWQRNREFAIRVGAGVAVLLVALIVRGCTYSDDPRVVTSAIGRAHSSIRDQRFPRSSVARELARRVEALDEATAREAGIVGVVRKPGDSIAQDMCLRILARIGKDDPATRNDLARLAKTSPNACFSHLFDEVRSHYQQVAVEEDIPIVEDLGFGDSRFADDEIMRAFHALDLVTRAVETAVTKARVESVDKVVVRMGRPQPGRGGTELIERDTVELTIQARPERLYLMLDAFNDPERFVPIEDFRVGGRQKRKTSHRAMAVVAVFELAAVRIDLEPEEES